MENIINIIENCSDEYLVLNNLDIDDEMLSNIQDKIESLTGLTELHLEHNKLTSFPNFNMPYLELLNLSNNRLTDISDAIFHDNLRWLYLYNNPLNSVFPYSVYKSDSNMRLTIIISHKQINNIYYHIERNTIIWIRSNSNGTVDTGATTRIQKQNKHNKLPSRKKSARSTIY